MTFQQPGDTIQDRAQLRSRSLVTQAEDVMKPEPIPQREILQRIWLGRNRKGSFRLVAQLVKPSREAVVQDNEKVMRESLGGWTAQSRVQIFGCGFVSSLRAAFTKPRTVPRGVVRPSASAAGVVWGAPGLGEAMPVWAPAGMHNTVHKIRRIIQNRHPCSRPVSPLSRRAECFSQPEQPSTSSFIFRCTCAETAVLFRPLRFPGGSVLLLQCVKVGVCFEVLSTDSREPEHYGPRLEFDQRLL